MVLLFKARFQLPASSEKRYSIIGYFDVSRQILKVCYFCKLELFIISRGLESLTDMDHECIGTCGGKGNAWPKYTCKF